MARPKKQPDKVPAAVQPQLASHATQAVAQAAGLGKRGRKAKAKG